MRAEKKLSSILNNLIWSETSRSKSQPLHVNSLFRLKQRKFTAFIRTSRSELKEHQITTIIVKDLTIFVHLIGQNDLRHLLLGLLDLVALLLKPVECLKKIFWILKPVEYLKKIFWINKTFGIFIENILN